MRTAKEEREKELVPSGAHLAPGCDRDVCDGKRSYPTPTGPAGEHCWCPEGRLEADRVYAKRHNQPVPLTPAQLLGAAS